MSQHPSLRADKKGGHYRNVLKRWEKIKHLLEKDKWDPEEDSVYDLPKIKRIKMKIKKKKSAAEEEKPEEAIAETEAGEKIEDTEQSAEEKKPENNE